MERQDLSLSNIIRRLEKEGPEKWASESHKNKDFIHIDLDDRNWCYQFNFNIIIEDFWIRLLAHRDTVGLFKREKEVYKIYIYEKCSRGYWDWDRPVISFQGKEIKNLFDKVQKELREYWRQEDKERENTERKRQQETLNKLGNIFS